MVCGGLWWFVVDCGGLSFSHTVTYRQYDCPLMMPACPSPPVFPQTLDSALSTVEHRRMGAWISLRLRAAPGPG